MTPKALVGLMFEGPTPIGAKMVSEAIHTEYPLRMPPQGRWVVRRYWHDVFLLEDEVSGMVVSIPIEILYKFKPIQDLYGQKHPSVSQ